jgi:hypothetical protein
LLELNHRDLSAEKIMGFDLRFTDKEITAWGGMAIMKRMLDHLGLTRHSLLLACRNRGATVAIGQNN